MREGRGCAYILLATANYHTFTRGSRKEGRDRKGGLWVLSSNRFDDKRDVFFAP